jgi:hypothetical protein
MIQISFDKNIINSFNTKFVVNKLLPVFPSLNVIVYLTDPPLKEIILDKNARRRARISGFCQRIINSLLKKSFFRLFAGDSIFGNFVSSFVRKSYEISFLREFAFRPPNRVFQQTVNYSPL